MSAQNSTEKGLPTNVDAERFVLGSILLDDSFYIQAAGTLEVSDFSLEKHRRIFKRMGDVYERGEKIDRITVANELMKFNELESLRRPELPGFPGRRPAADSQRRRLHPAGEGQGRPAQHHLRVRST